MSGLKRNMWNTGWIFSVGGSCNSKVTRLICWVIWKRPIYLWSRFCSGCGGVLLIAILFVLLSKQAPVDYIGLHVVYKLVSPFPDRF